MSWKAIVLALVILYFLGGILLYLLQEKIIFLPEQTDQDHEYTFVVPFEERFLAGDDGAKIHALHFKPDIAKGIIVYFHGNAGNLERWGEVVEPLANLGYEVLIMDYRGYGKSTGKRTKDRMLKDSERVYQEALKSWKEEEVIVYGRSLGSSFASHIGGNFQPSKVILEAPFHSMADLAKNTIPIYPVKQILRFNFDNERSLSECAARVYIFHGNEDSVVPFESGSKLFDRIDCEKSFYEIDGGGHNDLQLFDEYWVMLRAILNSQTVK
jgi:pimeloyl-ACP methyl ester carboxylesterase